MSEPDEPPEHAVQPHTPVQGRNKRKQLTTGKVARKVRKVHSEKRALWFVQTALECFPVANHSVEELRQLRNSHKNENLKFRNFSILDYFVQRI